MTNPHNYSEKELKLLRILGAKESFLEDKYIDPGQAYEMFAILAFVQDDQSPEIDSLRRVGRVVGAIRSGKIYRQTPEFEDLIKFSEK